ncbi:MAG: cysteine--tRNA ligase [Candidatus Omnitrophica bacterium]|nr:cysteine--tRNA ligase [Candidatus Omnitrophota bacterium]
MLKIYNAITRSKQEFRPLKGKEVKMYTCGVTVYDDCHIGHARSLCIFEIIRRYLVFRGYKVNFVRNITDVDDKIINKARIWAKEQGISLQEAFVKVGRTYIESYYNDLAALGLPSADAEPKATENIKEMQNYIQALIDKGFAYEKEDGIYFSTKKDLKYGGLSGNIIEQMLSDVSDFSKEDALDFALWKKAKDDEPFWDSPWGKGRPGWHIECSVMSQKFLNTDTLDIHGGGRDLIFPHHENERAQAESLTSKPFARYWIHHGLLTINGQKMAKSLGNFVTIKDVLKKYPADILKIFYFQAHYSSPVDFSWEKMDEAKKAYERIYILLSRLDKYLEGRFIDKKIPFADKGKNVYFLDEFIEEMDDDFNMPKGLGVFFNLVSACNELLDGSDKEKDEKLAYAREAIKEMSDIFSFSFSINTPAGISDQEIEEKIRIRNINKAQKNYKQADKIRSDLDSLGIILEDTKDGTTWRRKI